jgi:ESCRT-I complex subunit VPS37
MLADPAYFQSVFHSLPRVKALFQAQTELGMANESIAGLSWGSLSSASSDIL